MLVDTHCHLGDVAFQADLAEVVDRAVQAGVGHVVVIGESPEAAARARELARGNRRLSATAGIHPHQAVTWGSGSAGWLAAQLADDVVVAAGEMGLDYHYDNSPRDRQQEAFDAQLGLAQQAGKPAVIHARDADDDVAAILRNHPRATAILHSWSSGPSLLGTAIRMGHYFGLSGMVTFRSWAGDSALGQIPPERLLLETDAPYLAPVPHRGKRNEPAWVALIARRVGQVLGLPDGEVERLTTENAVRVFGQRVRSEP